MQLDMVETWLSVSTPIALVQAYEEHVQELDRLRWIHEPGQLQLITALAWQAKQEAMLASAKASLDKPSALQV